MASSKERPDSRLRSTDSEDTEMKSEENSVCDEQEDGEVDVVGDVPLEPSPPKRSSGFSIDDILSDKFTPSIQRKTSAFVRPWDLPKSDTSFSESHPLALLKTGKDLKKSKNSPLDALFKMASKTFEGFERPESKPDSCSQSQSSGNSGNGGNLKKKRKSRTAFTNHQVFELEKRFLYQKYLSPADRDEIAQSLGLSNAQVITWFQNRRAKLKRDIEELKKDVTATRIHTLQKSLYDNVRDAAMLRAKFHALGCQKS